MSGRAGRSGNRQDGCPVCGYVLDPEKGVKHPRFERTIHPNCAKFLSWRGVGATKPDDLDPEDEGRGYDPD